MKKIRKNTQLTFINPRRAGRPAMHDKGIRHCPRDRIKKPSALHLTIKVKENKADIRNKTLLKALHHAIQRARLKGLKVLHYALEHNHVHLLVEASNNRVLHRGMQSFGISFAKAVNRFKSSGGNVYKHRYHFKMLNSRREFKNVLIYIFKNGMKHKRTRSMIDPYNSLAGEKRISADIAEVIKNSFFLCRLRVELESVLDLSAVFFVPEINMKPS